MVDGVRNPYNRQACEWAYCSIHALSIKGDIMKVVTGSAIYLADYADYNVFFYHQSVSCFLGILIGVVLGCFFWGLVYDRIS